MAKWNDERTMTTERGKAPSGVGEQRMRDLESTRLAIELADAAVGWWEDHNREDCHFCGVREDGSHDDWCPVGIYAAAKRAELQHGA